MQEAESFELNSVPMQNKLNKTPIENLKMIPISELRDICSPFRLSCVDHPKTLVELGLIQFSSAIRSKPNWHKKIDEPIIQNTWKHEAISQGLTARDIDYVFDELRYLATLYEEPIQLSLTHGIYESATAVDIKLASDFIVAASNLEDSLADKKDWHPGSSERVWNLIHPSLYCLVWNVSRRTMDDEPKSFRNWCGTGDILSDPAKVSLRSDLYTGKYQWLPCEVSVDLDGNASIQSYINNLHPDDHTALYPLLEKILSAFIPMFEKVLLSCIVKEDNIIDVDPYSWYDYSEPPKKKRLIESRNNGNDSPDSDYYDRIDAWWVTREPQRPCPPLEYTPIKHEKYVSLRGTKLQVIVKMANIVLSPMKSTYEGGTWHVEGMENESIVATGIYYYKCENISESRLHFRKAVSEPDYVQSDNRGIEAIYGLRNEGDLNQELGYVQIEEGKMLAFPNIYQHRVAPFELTDKTKNGFRKILVFFLVNPAKRIISSECIPPQQKEWMMREMPQKFMRSLLDQGIMDVIFSFLDWPMSFEDALRYRDELMHERKFYFDEVEETLFTRVFSLCEH